MIFYLPQPQQVLLLLKTKIEYSRFISGKYDLSACAQKAVTPIFQIYFIHRNISAFTHCIPLTDIGVELLGVFGGSPCPWWCFCFADDPFPITQSCRMTTFSNYRNFVASCFLVAIICMGRRSYNLIFLTLRFRIYYLYDSLCQIMMCSLMCSYKL